MGDDNPRHLDDLRQRAEAKLQADADEIRTMPPMEVAALVHELRTHQIELELQNEELRTVQTDLVETRDRYQDLYDLAPVGYVTTSDKGLILEANLTLADMLRIERGRLINQPLSAYVLEEDQDIYFLHRRPLTESGQRAACEVRMRSPEVGPFWARMECFVQIADDGEHRLRTTISDVSERRRAQDKIAASLDEKGLLLREIHHRVKNNMQVIVSLLRLQAATISEPAALAAFSRCEDRVRAMAIVHEKLYGSESPDAISCRNFIDDLTQAVACAYGAKPSRLIVDVGEVSLGMDRAVPLGLIITELVSNSLTHAFPDGRAGKISVSLKADDDKGGVRLIVSDDGVGFSEEAQAPGKGSLGMVLVELLAQGQLGGTLKVKSDAGTTVTIAFSSSNDGVNT